MRNKRKIFIKAFPVMGEESESMAPMSEVTFSDEIEQAKRVVKILKEEEKVDFILCLVLLELTAAFLYEPL